jgi:hypothetical protein
MLTYFEQLALYAEYTGICEVCGTRVRRKIEATQTLNPWNLKNGRRKTREEIYEELRAELQEARNHPVHARCARDRAWGRTASSASAGEDKV